MPLDDERQQDDQTQLQTEPFSSDAEDATADPTVLTVGRIDAMLAGPEHCCTVGSYQIVERLGSGGMGKVYKAIHQTMGRTVALKIMSPRLVNKERAQARFQREVRGAGRLAHPNIVMFHDAAEERGLWFLVMEHIEGADLGTLVRRHGLPPLPVACEIIRQAALGLQHAHEQGMVHRDIKPGNLMLVVGRQGDKETGRGGDKEIEPDAQARALACASDSVTLPDSGWPEQPLVKILDFGIARLESLDNDPDADTTSALTQEGSPVGTPEFMAPEQALNSRKADIRSDIYSLGCTFYYLLTGGAPFTGDTAFEILSQHIHQPPEPVRSRRPEIPPALSAVVQRMLAKSPGDRYQTPQEVALDLLPWTDPFAPTATGSTTSKPKADALYAAYLNKGSNQPAGAMPGPAAPSGNMRALFYSGLALLALIVVSALFGVVALKLYDRQHNNAPAPPGRNGDAQQPPGNKGDAAHNIKMIAFPAGTFQLAGPDGRMVTFHQGFEISATEVTKAQFARFVEALPYQTAAEQNSKGSFVLRPNGEWVRTPAATWRECGLELSPDSPVVCVTWEDAIQYCNWLSREEGRRECYSQPDPENPVWICDWMADGYRLPTDAEWEYAARAGLPTLLPEPGSALADYAWLKENAAGRPHRVGEKKANPRQLHDVWGNVWEWCWDWEGPDSGKEPVDDPKGPPMGTQRIVRGGGWNDDIASMQAGTRKGLSPDYSSTDVGFRIVRTSKSQ